MKRTALIIAAFAFTLTGCAGVNADKEMASSPTETTVSIDSPQAPAIEPDKETAENVTGIFDVLNTLEYQPYTCDGLPEYLLTDTDGTVYSINFSEKWIWRGKGEQAELSDELIARLIEDKNLTQAENVPIKTNQPNAEIPTETTAPVDNLQSSLAEPEDETTEKDDESKITMEIALLKNGETIKTDKIDNDAKAAYFYDILNALKYEVTDDVSFREGVSVYFYDEDNNMLQSFQIYEKYLKLNSLPDTYKISNTDFDYVRFCDEIGKITMK